MFKCQPSRCPPLRTSECGVFSLLYGPHVLETDMMGHGNVVWPIAVWLPRGLLQSASPNVLKHLYLLMGLVAALSGQSKRWGQYLERRRLMRKDKMLENHHTISPIETSLSWRALSLSFFFFSLSLSISLCLSISLSLSLSPSLFSNCACFYALLWPCYKLRFERWSRGQSASSTGLGKSGLSYARVWTGNGKPKPQACSDVSD